MSAHSSRTVRVHRFQDEIAIHAEDHSTIYINRKLAASLAQILEEAASDAERVPFFESDFKAVTIDVLGGVSDG